MSDPKPFGRVIDKEVMRILHLELQGEPCEMCGINTGTQLDHVIPRSRGGDDTPENLRWVCVLCHTKRHS